MRILNVRMTAVLSALALFMAVATIVPEARAQSPLVNQDATQILERMTDYLGGLKKFSVHTQNTVEDELATGNRVDYSIAADVIVSRPNKLHSKRKGDLINQSFYYDGKTVTLYNAADKVYATQPAPGTIEGMFGFARDSLGLVVPIADLVPPCLSTADGGRKPGRGGRQGSHRGRHVRPSALQPPGGRLPGMGR